ncbi:MAG: transglutaminase family protein [Ruminococcus sp.]
MTHTTTSPSLHIQPDPAYAMSGSRRNSWNLLTLLLALLGFAGTMMAMLSLYQPECHTGLVCITAAAGFFLGTTSQLLPGHGGKITGLCLLLVAAVLLLRVSQTVAGIQYIINTIYCNAHHTDIPYYTVSAAYDTVSCVTLTACCFTVLLAYFIAFFTIKHPHFTLTAGVTFLLLEPGLYLGLSVKPIAMAPLLAYWCGMLALRLAMRCTGDAQPKSARHTAAVCGSVTALFVLAVYTVVVLLGTLGGYTRSDADRQRINDLSDSLSDFDIQNLPESVRTLGAALGFESTSRVSKLGTKSSLHFQDEPELTLTFDTLPDSTMYLKGFTASEYQDNSWMAPSKDTDADYGETVYEIIEKYDCAPQNFPFLFQRSLLPDTGTFTCTVTPEKQDSRYYQPYVSFSSDVSFSDDWDVRPDDRETYSWTVSDPQTWVLATLADSDLQEYQMAMKNASGNTSTQKFLDTLGFSDTGTKISARFKESQAADSPEEIQGKVIPAMLLESLAYRDYVKDAYTKLPDEEALAEVYAALPASLTEKHPESAEEQYGTLSEIRAWMAERTEYTTSPGKTPGTRDFISFFLMENHKGYCMHYAAAGTILARYLGIPARYCEGYLVGKDMLESAEISEDGYTVTLTDRQAHAWCEFYIDGYGWMPFEMTPGYYGTSASAQTAEPSDAKTTTAVTEENATTETGQISLTSTTILSESAPGRNSEVIPDSMDHSGDGNSLPPESAHSDIPPWLLRTLLGILIVAILIGIVILLRLWDIRRRNRIMLDTQHPRQAVLTAYRYLFRLLRWSGLRYHGQLLMDFSEEAVEHLEKKHLPSEAAAQIIPMALAMDMGRKVPEKAAQAEAAASVQTLAQSIYASCNPLKRICMKYILHLL